MIVTGGLQPWSRRWSLWRRIRRGFWLIFQEAQCKTPKISTINICELLIVNIFLVMNNHIYIHIYMSYECNYLCLRTQQVILSERNRVLWPACEMPSSRHFCAARSTDAIDRGGRPTRSTAQRSESFQVLFSLRFCFGSFGFRVGLGS